MTETTGTDAPAAASALLADSYYLLSCGVQLGDVSRVENSPHISTAKDNLRRGLVVGFTFSLLLYFGEPLHSSECDSVRSIFAANRYFPTYVRVETFQRSLKSRS